MPQIEGPKRTFQNGGTAINRRLRVKLTAGVLALAGLADGDEELGVADARIEANALGAVDLRNRAGTCEMVAVKAIDVGDLVYSAANGKISDVAATGSTRIGQALEAATADGDIIEVLRE